MKGVIYTDVFQFCVMVGGVIAILAMVSTVALLHQLVKQVTCVSTINATP